MSHDSRLDGRRGRAGAGPPAGQAAGATATLERPAPRPPHGAPAPEPAPAPRTPGETALVVATVALVVAAVLPLTRVYIGLDFLRPVLAAALLAVGVARGARWLGSGPVIELLLSVAAWALFVALAFFPQTLAWGVLPTWETAGALRDLWLGGIEQIRTRPSPAYAEPGMLLITATGVWWVAHAIEGLVFRLRAPLRAIAMALLLWTVPLAMASSARRPWLWAVPLLAAAAAVLLAEGRLRLAGGRGDALPTTGTPPAARGSAFDTLSGTGGFVAVLAITAGAVLGGLLPGYGQPPYYEVRGLGGTTITTNPIVSIRSSLVSQGRQPVVEVRSQQPVYLRLTALDVYSEREEWTSAGIRGGAAGGRLAPETEWVGGRELTVNVEVRGLPGAVIVPVPYQPLRLSGPVADRFQYDRDGATVTLAAGESLDEGDTYEVQALLPDPPAEVLAATPVDGAPASLTALPASVPPEVGHLAREIVQAAGASTPFEQAMALQRELRSWTYSLDPPQGHSSSAMLSFLEQRIGYCEQFAGTMAVMLRTLGIPARVAVGYTPGDLVAEDPDGSQVYQVTNANAHAWVEVLFPGLGWIPFEPTPRSDGNLLTPTASNLSPTATDAQRRTPTGEGFGAWDELEEMLFLDRLTGDEPSRPLEEREPSGGEAGGGARLGTVGLVLAALALVAGLLGWRRRGDGETLVPAEEVLRIVARVERTGRGLGVARRGAETNAEYLRRLAGPVRDAGRLAAAADQARYAPFVPAALAAGAEDSARSVLRRLRGERSRTAWLAASARGWLSGGAARVPGRIRRGALAASNGSQPAADRLARLVRRRAVRRDSGRTR